ncbi:MAG: hypothetical protein ACLUNS_01960 [Alistipes shahii]
MLSISAVTVADGIFVGHGVGSDGIAAVNIYVPLLMLFRGGADDRHQVVRSSPPFICRGRRSRRPA